MNPKIHIALSGHYKIVATKKDGSKRTLADWFENLILDGGLNRLGTGGAWSQAQVGSGNTAPAEGQTALTTLVATTTSIQGTAAGTNTPTDTYAWARRTYRFAEGVAAGNLSEVGIGWAGGLFSRSLIKDELGNPTTITVLSDEALDIIYEIRAYPTMTDQTVVLNISGTNYTFTIRPAFFSGDQTSTTQWPWQLMQLMNSGAVGTGEYYLGWAAYGNGASLGAVTGNIGGTLVVGAGDANVSSTYREAYANNSYQRLCRVRFGLNAGSVAFGGLCLSSLLGHYQMTVSPNLPKDATKVFSLDYTLSWARKAI